MFLFNELASFHFLTETRKMIDYGAAATFAMAMGWFMYFPASIMLKNPLRPASGALVTMEQVKITCILTHFHVQAAEVNFHSIDTLQLSFYAPGNQIK